MKQEYLNIKEQVCFFFNLKQSKKIKGMPLSCDTVQRES